MIKNLTSVRHLRVAGFAAGAVWVTASAAGYNVAFLSPSLPSGQASAASAGQQTSAASAACADFATHFATDLGTSQSNVTAAFQKAIGQTLDDQVKNGTLKQAQADAIKKKVAGKAPCALLPTGTTKPPSAQAGAYKQLLLSASASALGISDSQLKADLAQGMTLSQIAAAQKPPITEDQFRARLIKNLTSLLDEAVAAGKLTSAQEQAIIKRLETGAIPYWNTPMGSGKAAATSPSPSSS